MRDIWSDDRKYRYWLDVELAVSEVLAERGEVPRDAVDVLRARADVDANRVAEIEREVRHDVIAFLTSVAERVGPEARWLHYGMTSSDVLDTALALQIRDAGALVREGVDRVVEALRRRALDSSAKASIACSRCCAAARWSSDTRPASDAPTGCTPSP
jgi:adenylosuccinate lyase